MVWRAISLCLCGSEGNTHAPLLPLYLDSHLFRLVQKNTAAGGRTSDYKAYQKSTILNWIENLMPMYFVAGDNACVCTEHLLNPFCGNNHSIPENDAYNFYLSQLQIRVEMKFSLFKTEWRILQTALEVPLAEAPMIFQVSWLLHNYCINECLQLDEEICIERMHGEDNTHQLGYIPSETVSLPHSGLVLHNRIIQRISNKSLSCPELNVQCQNLEDARKAMYFDVE